MKNRFTVLAALIIALPTSAFAQGKPETPKGWSFSVGAGMLYAPSYEGDDEGRLSALPNVQVTYADKFFASVNEGIGYNVIHHKGFKAGPVLKYNFGRDEDGSNSFAITGDDTNDLRGLGDVDGSVEIGGYIEYKWRPLTAKLALRQGIGGHEGLLGEASVQYGGMTMIGKQRVIYSIGPSLDYTGGNYNEAYFGVDAAQSAASGLARYDADSATVSYGLGGSLVIPHTKHISTIAFANYKRLGDTIADSSLVETRGDDDQFTTGVFLNYKF